MYAKRTSCKCGSTDHKNITNSKCKLNKTLKPRAKPTSCPVCKQTNHLRSSSRKCPQNKVVIFFSKIFFYYIKYFFIIKDKPFKF